MAMKYQINWVELTPKLEEMVRQDPKEGHHRWFPELERIIPMRREALLQISAEAYLESVPESERHALIEKVKGATT